MKNTIGTGLSILAVLGLIMVGIMAFDGEPDLLTLIILAVLIILVIVLFEPMVAGVIFGIIELWWLINPDADTDMVKLNKEIEALEKEYESLISARRLSYWE